MMVASIRTAAVSLSNILQRLAHEPAVIGGFAASILPALVVLDVLTLSGDQIAAILVLVNATVALLVRLLVTPRGKGPGPDPEPEPAPAG
jgi:hypothetical protein